MKFFALSACLVLCVFLAQTASAQEEPEEYSFTEERTVQMTAPAEEASEGYADEDDGAMVLGEVAFLSLPADDDAVLFRGILAYTFEVGFQIGAGLSGVHLNRPCLPSAAVPSGTCAAPEADDASDFAGPTPFLGWDIELVQGWFGFELTAMGTFPVTGGSSGWAVEGGVSPYFSFEALSKDSFDLALLAGIKYLHADIEIDLYQLETDEIMPSWGVMGQF